MICCLLVQIAHSSFSTKGESLV